MGLILVVNLHGTINSPSGVRKALTELKVARKFAASVVTDDAPTVGMLRLCKNYIAWAPVERDLLVALLKKRGMVTETKSLDADSLKKLGFKKHEDIADKMAKDQIRLSLLEGVRPFFRLAPPKGGFKKSLRRQYTEKGLLGSNPDLRVLVEKMM